VIYQKRKDAGSLWGVPGVDIDLALLDDDLPKALTTLREAIDKGCILGSKLKRLPLYLPLREHRNGHLFSPNQISLLLSKERST
jgi:hypothetical protein